jgi:hypothetical protein
MTDYPEHDSKADQLDRAVSDRLARLRAMPLDVSALRRAVDAQVSAPTAETARPRPSIFRLFSPMRAVAASLLVGGLVIALVIASASGPVLASADRMAQVHDEMVAGDGHGSHGRQAVNSIEAANAALRAQHGGAPAVPDVGPEQVMSCCVHMVGRKRMSCVTLMSGGVPVSLAVADAADVRMPASETVVADGVTYHVQSARGVNMAMAQRDGRWVCLMGKLPTARLIDLAKQLRF